MTAKFLPTGFAHAGVTVRDMERSLHFYGEGLGLQCINRRVVDNEFIKQIVQVSGVDSIEVAYLALPDGRVVAELLQYNGCQRQAGNMRPCDPGCGHFCLLVSDMQCIWRQALAAGGSARSPQPIPIANGPYAGGYSGYLADPDGYFIELLQPPQDVSGKGFLGPVR